jgi:hypothetical protein
MNIDVMSFYQIGGFHPIHPLPPCLIPWLVGKEKSLAGGAHRQA